MGRIAKRHVAHHVQQVQRLEGISGARESAAHGDQLVVVLVLSVVYEVVSNKLSMSH